MTPRHGSHAKTDFACMQVASTSLADGVCMTKRIACTLSLQRPSLQCICCHTPGEAKTQVTKLTATSVAIQSPTNCWTYKSHPLHRAGSNQKMPSMALALMRNATAATTARRAPSCGCLQKHWLSYVDWLLRLELQFPPCFSRRSVMSTQIICDGSTPPTLDVSSPQSGLFGQVWRLNECVTTYFEGVRRTLQEHLASPALLRGVALFISIVHSSQ